MFYPNSTSSHLLPTHKMHKGKHKIFVGMAPGVGKTYRMLEEAQWLKQQGKDVVIGLLDAHNRKETIEKAQGLEVVPRKAVERCGLIFYEMDTESILARQPQLVLVDDLAHTNFPGSDHESRYQDVEDLLNADIDVYSTVNIQHLESLSNAVAKIPGLIVKNHLPDRLIEEAREVVAIDVTPETLQERIRDGKICAPESIERSLATTFQWQNLVTLRELVLRQVANHIEEVRIREGDQFSRNITNHSNVSYCLHERVLVCISCSCHSVQLIQRGAYLANVMNASLYALFVDRPDHPLSKTEALYLNTCEQLCHDFSGEFLRVESFEVPATIAKVAKSQHITQVMLGKTNHLFRRLSFHRPIVDQLIELLPDQTDLHVISTIS